MAAGANIGSAIGGFGRGLASALIMNRERSDQKKREERERADRAFQYQLPVLIKLGEDTGDWSALETAFATAFPDQAKSWKKDNFSMASIAPLLQRPSAMRGQQSTANVPQVPTGMTPPPGTPPQAEILPSRAAVAPATPVQRKTLFGVELPTDEERLEKRTRALTAEGEADIQAKVNVARKLSTTLNIPMEEALDRVGLRETQRTIEPFQSVAGEFADGKPGFGVFDQTRGIYVHPETKQPLIGFRPKTSTGNSDLDLALDTYARGKNKSVSQLTWEEMLEARKAISEATERPVVIQTATGPQVVERSQGTASPITSSAGGVIGPAPTAEMRNRQEARKLVIPAVNEIEKLGQQVITRIGPAQRADAARRGVAAVLGNDPEWRTYRDARMALAGNLAVLQQGSRPSDADIRAVWLPLVPDVFEDTTASAEMKWRLIRIMSSIDPSTGQPVTQGTTPPPAAAPGAAPAPNQQTIPGVVTRDGKIFVNGVEVK